MPPLGLLPTDDDEERIHERVDTHAKTCNLGLMFADFAHILRPGSDIAVQAVSVQMLSMEIFGRPNLNHRVRLGGI